MTVAIAIIRLTVRHNKQSPWHHIHTLTEADSLLGITGDDPRIDPTYPDPHRKGYKGQRMCGTYELTRVLSISYSLPEEEYPVNYLRRQCDEVSLKIAVSKQNID